MALDEQRLRIRRSLEEKLGMEEASYLMDRPVGGWSELVTNHTLDLKFAVLDERFRAVDERFRSVDARFDALTDAFEGKLAATEHRLLAEIERRARIQTWSLVTAMLAGFSVLGAIQQI